MEVFVFRGLPGSPTVRVARRLLSRPVDYIVDLTDYRETGQGNLFVVEGVPPEAEETVEDLMRSPQISRLAVCGMMDKEWLNKLLREIDVEMDVYWLVVEGAKMPSRGSRKLYKRLEKTFSIDLYAS